MRIDKSLVSAQQHEKKFVFRSAISTGSYSEFLLAIFSLVEHKVPSYVCFANVHMIVEAYHNKAFREVVNNAAIVAPDGKPLSVFLRLFKGLKQDRICGMDMMPDLLALAESLDKSVYFYGTTNDMLLKIVQRTKNEFPSLRIAGYFSPPFKKVTPEEMRVFVSQIKKTAPDLVFVALGCPKQEIWMARNKDEIGACLLGLGQAFHVYAGTEKRLPVWMRHLSLEWIYRLYQEPDRLWRRYMFTNSYFMFLVGRYAFYRLFRGRSFS
jgi:N-acetylglucosaminyldiphosphoundecaprenol N-acetyl-beta-D-mannosaminyltransferase